LCDILLPLQTR
jgi:hypothetical protein